jgi:hypothetical protein
MAVQATELTVYEVRFICGPAEGIRHIRALDADDAIAELQENASWYGINERCLAVSAVPVRRVVRRVGGRI